MTKMSIRGTLETGLLRTHQAIYAASGGAIGHRLLGVPTLLLSTTGRRTGQRRTTALVYATDIDSSLIVTASNGGADRAPGWLQNVEADGSIEAQIGRRRLTGHAQVIGPQHAEYARLWTVVNRNAHGRYDRYQRRTDRVIKLVRLQIR